MDQERLQYDKRSGINLVLAREYRFRDDIDMGEFRISDEVLFTSAAFTCIALAAHNSQSNHGLVGHFNSISEPGEYASQESFQQALLGIASLGAAEHTDIWLGGGSPYLEDGHDTVAVDRTFAEDAIGRFAKAFRLPDGHVEIEWSAESHVVDVELDCQNGRLVVHDYPDIPIRELAKLASSDPKTGE